MNHARRIVVLGALCGLLGAGCAGSSYDTLYQTQQIESQDAVAVLAAAERILRTEFGRVTVDEERRMIVTAPAARAGDEAGTTGADRLRGGVVRRTATLWLNRRGDSMVARLRVDIEREETAQQRAIPTGSGRLSDTPGYTPIERDAATSYRQNTVWTKVGRDRKLERALLDELRQRFNPQPTTRAALAARHGAGDEPRE